MESTLMVIGVSGETAPVAVRERFWIREDRRADALTQLSRAEGIDELIVLATGRRTEFIVWTRDAFAASASVLSFLTLYYGLRLDDWGHFYRKLDRAAMAHLLKLLAGLPADGEPDITAQVKSAWTLAQQAGLSKGYLDAVVEKSLGVSERLRPIAAEQVQAIVADVAKKLYAELQPETARPAVAGTGR